MEYRILNDTSNTGLSYQVNEFINKGWSLYGPLNVISINHGLSYETAEFYQAIIKEDKKISAKLSDQQEAFK